jgi:hypothetical protein
VHILIRVLNTNFVSYTNSPVFLAQEVLKILWLCLLLQRYNELRFLPQGIFGFGAIIIKVEWDSISL